MFIRTQDTESNYTKSPTHERTPFQEHVLKANLFVSPMRLALVPTNKIGYIVLYYSWFIILLTQMKQTQKNEKNLMLQYSTLKNYSTIASTQGLAWSE